MRDGDKSKTIHVQFIYYMWNQYYICGTNLCQGLVFKC